VRIPRLLTILGPASVLYVLAARASSQTSVSPEWLVAVCSLALALTPLAVLGARSSSRGASWLALMGVSLAIATAAARTASPLLDRTHDIAWLVVALSALDLVLARDARPLVRAGVAASLALAAFLSGTLAQDGLLPASAFGVVVVAILLATGALHQIALVARGHVVEGALSGVALVSLAVGLAYSWFGPFSGLLATTLEMAVASLLWLGHLAWLDPRWRSLRRVGIPAVAAGCVCFVATFVLVPEGSLERWQLGTLALGSGVLWWLAFSLVRKLSNRTVWSTSCRLADAAAVARRSLAAGATLEDIATRVLPPLTAAFDGVAGSPELYTLEPPLRVRLEAGGRVNVKSSVAPEAVARALFAGEHHRILDLAGLRPRAVREPSIREAVDAMQARSIGCVLPCVHLEHVEGLLFLPPLGQSETLSRIELAELRRLGEALGGSLVSALAQRRADTHIHRISSLQREAEERATSLEREVDQLRGQCDVLGRGLAEDQTLHVAYSQSMRRVQTRAIELALVDDSVLLIAPAGSPVLPVARFIHERGPRWEAPFIVADCAAAPPDQVMSLLFGSESERLAGWFQSATGGTLLLRDVPALPKSAQARLARSLAAQGEGTNQDVPPRLIATSRTALNELRRRGALDSDLATCFSGPGLAIPPLRERREDVPSLALLAIDRACRVLAREPVGIEQRAMGALVDHDWPGDVSELELVIELAVANASSTTIAINDLPPLAWPGADEGDSLSGTYVEVECRLLERALLRSGGNKSEAARLLGLKRTTFLDKLRRHGLEQRAVG
jgi:DNA-binding NtrC family response regulator